MTQLCINGAGVATPPNFLIEKEIANNTLIQLLPKWEVEWSRFHFTQFGPIMYIKTSVPNDY